MDSIFFDITVVLCFTAVLAILFRLLKQPPMLAYILAGIIIGPLALFHIHNISILRNFSDLGITLVLFLLGLELQLKDLRSVGKVVIGAGTAQVFITGALAFGVCLLLGIPLIASFYVSAALTFSSTIIVIKLLSDKKDINSLYGKLSVGLLLMQDFFAILLLMFLSGYQPVSSAFAAGEYFLVVLIKSVLLFAVIVGLSRSILPRIIHRIARSPETLFLFSLAWVFGISALVSSRWVGFSIEIGGFLAGIALANSVENFQIAAKIRPLRDFFIIIFFVFLGVQMGTASIMQIIFPALVLSLFVILVKPVIVMIIMGFAGYRKRTSFFTGINLSQVSEFSLILIVLGQKAGQIPESIVSLVTIIAIVTFATSTYGIMNNNALYKKIGKFLNIFELRKGENEHLGAEGTFDDHILVIGGRRMADAILETLKATDEQVVVVDFDPDTVKKLQEKGVTVIFGDIIDTDIQERAHFDKAKLVISTLSDLEDNLFLMKATRHANKKAKMIVLAYDTTDANILYRAGADYVVLPHLAGGRQIARALKSEELEKLEDLREKDKMYLAQ